MQIYIFKSLIFLFICKLFVCIYARRQLSFRMFVRQKMQILANMELIINSLWCQNIVFLVSFEKYHYRAVYSSNWWGTFNPTHQWLHGIKCSSSNGGRFIQHIWLLKFNRFSLPSHSSPPNSTEFLNVVSFSSCKLSGKLPISTTI